MIFMKNKDILLEKLKKLECSKNIIDLFQAFAIIVSYCDEEKMDLFINKNKDLLYNADPIKFMSSHIDFYVLKERYVEALEILKQYQDAPFINLTTDDFMTDLHNTLLKKINPKKLKVEFTNEDLIRELYSNDEDKFLHSVKFLSDSNVRKYLPIVEDVLSSNVLYKLKILLQFVLIEQGIDKKICVKKDDGDLFYFIPNKTNLPFSTNEYASALKYIKSLNESPSVIDNTIQLMNMIEVRVFPFSFLKRYSTPMISSEIIVFLTKKLLLENPNINELYMNTEIDINELNVIIEDLTRIIS